MVGDEKRPSAAGAAAAGVGPAATAPLSQVIDLVRPPNAPSRASGRVFLDALRALFLREVFSRYGAFRFGYVWAVAQPLLFVLMINETRALFRGQDQHIYGVSGIYFFLIGVLPFFMYQQGFHQAMGAMSSFRGVFNYREVRPIDIILVRCGIEFALLLIVIGLFMLGLHWFDSPIDVDDPLGFIAAIGLLFIFTQGVGLTADVYVTRNPDTRRIFTLIDRPLFFISGVFFTAEVMPEGVREILMWNPLLHAIDLGRGALLSEYESPCSWIYLSLWAFGMLLFGFGAYRRNMHFLTA